MVADEQNGIGRSWVEETPAGHGVVIVIVVDVTDSYRGLLEEESLA
jgi:hypothetical protein